MFSWGYRLEIQSITLLFSTQLCELMPLEPSIWFNSHPLPPPPFPVSKYSTVYVQTVCGWKGVGVLSPHGDHILQEFNTLYLTKFRTYKIVRPLQTKPRRGRQINTCRKVPLQVNTFRWRHFALVSIQLIIPCWEPSSTEKEKKSALGKIQPSHSYSA